MEREKAFELYSRDGETIFFYFGRANFRNNFISTFSFLKKNSKLAQAKKQKLKKLNLIGF